MAVFTPPLPFVEPAGYRIGSGPIKVDYFVPVLTAGVVTGGDYWAPFQAGQNIHSTQLDAVATAIERLLLQDFSQRLELTQADVDFGFNPDGSQAIAGFKVTLDQVNDAPSLFHIGNWNPDIITAWSFRTMIREELGIGTPYTPA